VSSVALTELTGLQWSEDGYAALSGDLLDWAQKLDAHIGCWADDFGATNYRFPALIPAKSLAPIAYLRSFPHLASFVTSGDRRETSLQALARDCATAERIALCEDRFEPVEQLLTPAACYHFYPRFAGNRLRQPLFLSTRCQCFRREEHYQPLQRQWSFEMREIVCIGEPATVEEFTAVCAGRIETLLKALDLDCSWQVATDPFFDPQTDPKALAQILEPTKKELCTAGGLAIGSVNHHRSFFGESYDIKINTAAAHSACVAFGIERWLYAMAQRHGTDIAIWPVPGGRV
jgi:hypothetical protein